MKVQLEHWNPNLLILSLGLFPGTWLALLWLKSLDCTEYSIAVHGYFKPGLDKESSLLTTFLLSEGRCRYLRAPMGLNASSDEWCRHSEKLIEGLPRAMKIVDDIITWAST